jgi:uncharacterized protein YyaL (SSP411 family)
MAASALLRLAAFTGEARYRDTAEAALRMIQPLPATYPTAFAQWLQALDFALSRPKEIAIVGDPAAADTRALLRVVRDAYRPNQVVAVGRAGDGTAIPLLAGREAINGMATAYVCENFTCQMPITSPETLAGQL